jgi:hypothetical protein
MTWRKYLLELAHACGEVHPALVSLDRIDVIDGFTARSAKEVFGYAAGWGEPTAAEREDLRRWAAGGQ